MTIASNKYKASVWREIRGGLFRLKSVIWALVFKEFKVRLGKGKLGIIWVLVEPVVSMLTMSAIWFLIGREKIENTHVMLYIGSGFVIFLFVRRGIAPIPMAIISNEALLNYPQVKPIDTVLARFVLEMWLHSIASCWLFLSLWWILGITPSFPDPLMCFEAIAVAMLLSLGIAMPLAVYGTFNESITKMVGILSQPLMILSAVLYSMNDLPAEARGFLAWNPIVHIIESFRHGAFGTKLFVGHNLLYPAYLGLILLGFGFVAYYANRFKLLQK